MLGPWTRKRKRGELERLHFVADEFPRSIAFDYLMKRATRLELATLSLGNKCFPG